MRRYLTTQSLQKDSKISLEGEVFHHIHKVCRQDVGDRFELLNSQDDQAYLAEVTQVDKRSMQVHLLQARPLPKLQPPFIHLVLSFPKPKVFESVLEKSVELGVASIQPVLSEFSFFKSPDKLANKAQRWKKIVTSAMQQSGRFEALGIKPIQSLEQFLKDMPAKKPKKDLYLAFYEGQAQALSAYLQKQKTDLSDFENIWVFVGSEGGFSKNEIQNFQNLEVPSLSLGDQVLRVETACVSIVSVLRYMSGLVLS